MSKLNSLLTKAKTFTSKSSGFDMSNYRLMTGKCGQLLPCFCAEVLPRDKWSIGMMSQIDLPPAATNFQGRIDMRYEAFFVPNRLLWGGWQSFVTMPTDNPYSFDIRRQAKVPSIMWEPMNEGTPDDIAMLGRDWGVGSLADALGLRLNFEYNNSGVATGSPVAANGDISPNALPFLAYHRIYDDWYRNSQIQTPLFVNNPDSQNEFEADNNLWALPWLQTNGLETQEDDYFRIVYGTTNSATGSSGYAVCNRFYNGDEIQTIHQRNWADDLYTTCALYPQSSVNPSKVAVQSNSFSIPALRIANTIQRFRERYNIAGQRYIDQMLAAWGIKPADANLQRPLWLGSYSHGVYTSPIFNQSGSDNPSSSKNPQNGELGSAAGSVSGYGKDSLVKSFTATEHGYIIILCSLVPHAFYSNAFPEMFKRSELGDFADPLLQGLGDQPVPTGELTGVNNQITSSGANLFGYRPQYATYKYRNDEVCGLLRNVQNAAGTGPLNLAPFCLQRTLGVRRLSISPSAALDSDFLQIPIDFLDQVFNVNVAQSGWSWRGYMYFDVKAIRPLATYIIPTLENTQHMKTMTIKKGGTQING